ncbi:MAG: NAD-dependent epimerase/dehydratase family protein [Verrucomicrobiota bacterium]
MDKAAEKQVILGGTGFIGKALAARLGEQAIPLGSATFDLSDAAETDAWFAENDPASISHIFHLAAVYKAGGWPATHPATQFHANMAFNLNALEAWKRHAPQARFTSVVSYCMYPDHDRPHPETELYGTEPEPYLFAYAFTKKALLIGQRAYAKEFGLSATSCVLPTVYGPGDSFAEDSHVMGALIGKFSRAKASGDDEVEVWGDGSQEREFLFVEDAVDGILAASERATSEVLNLGAGLAHSIQKLAETIRAETGFEGKIRYNTDRFVGAKRRVLDSSKTVEELGWLAVTPLAEGIRTTIASYDPASNASVSA